MEKERHSSQLQSILRRLLRRHEARPGAVQVGKWQRLQRLLLSRPAAWLRRAVLDRWNRLQRRVAVRRTARLRQTAATRRPTKRGHLRKQCLHRGRRWPIAPLTSQPNEKRRCQSDVEGGPDRRHGLREPKANVGQFKSTP